MVFLRKDCKLYFFMLKKALEVTDVSLQVFYNTLAQDFLRKQDRGFFLFVFHRLPAYFRSHSSVRKQKEKEEILEKCHFHWRL